MDLTDLGTVKAAIGLEAGRFLSVGSMQDQGAGYSSATAMPQGTGQGTVLTPIIVGARIVAIRVDKQGFGWDPATTSIELAGDGAGAIAGPPVVENLDTAGDDPIARLISAASEFAIDYVGLLVAEEEEDLASTDYFDGDHTSTLLLRRHPVRSVSEVKDTGNVIPPAVPDGNGVMQPGWFQDGDLPDLIRLVGQRFSRGTRNIAVTYEAGFVVGESDLEPIVQAVVQIVSAWWARRDSYGYASKNLAGEHGTVATYSKDDIPAEAVAILDRFRIPRAA